MKTAIFPEHLGNIQGNLFLQELAQLSAAAPAALDAIRAEFPGGFTVVAEFELPVYETAEEKTAFVEQLQSRAARGDKLDAMLGALFPPGKRLRRLVLERR